MSLCSSPSPSPSPILLILLSLVAVNATVDPDSGNVVELAYVSDKIWYTSSLLSPLSLPPLSLLFCPLSFSFSFSNVSFFLIQPLVIQLSVRCPSSGLPFKMSSSSPRYSTLSPYPSPLTPHPLTPLSCPLDIT